MSHTPRRSVLAVLTLAMVGLVAAACGSTATPTATPPPEEVAVVPTRDPDLFADVLPLPPDVALPEGDFLVEPTSPRGMEIGMPVVHDLGHCGLFSPVDLDGSLWEPVGGVDNRGGPIDSDAEVGVLINATPGEAMLVAPSRLDWRAGRSGVVVVFERLEGARRYPGCQ